MAKECRPALAAIRTPEIIDETSLLPRRAPTRWAKAPQYCGALGKISNCQVAVSLHYAAWRHRPGGESESPRMGWRLFLERASGSTYPARRHLGRSVAPPSLTLRFQRTRLATGTDSTRRKEPRAAASLCSLERLRLGGAVEWVKPCQARCSKLRSVECNSRAKAWTGTAGLRRREPRNQPLNVAGNVQQGRC